MTFTDYAAANEITPTSPYADIIDALIDYYSEKRPHATLEQVEAWADKHAERYAE